MQLTIAHTESSLGWGGQENRILTETAGMIARGHRVMLFCCPQARIFDEARRRSIPVTPLPIEKKHPRGLFALIKALAVFKPQILNTHSSTDSWLSALACRFLNRKPLLVRTRHISSAVPDNFSKRWLYQSATRYIVTTGIALRNQLIEKNGYDGTRITSIPTGISLNSFFPGEVRRARQLLGLPLEGQIISCIATLRSWKGHADLLQALALMPYKPFLIIVGDGPQERNLRRLVEELHLQQEVHFAGYQSDVTPWLQASNLFVLPSYANEGVPQAILQAMACELPVISCPVGSVNEAVLHEITGLLVPPRNPQALQLAMSELLANSELRQYMGKKGRQHIEQQFQVEKMVEKMETLFYALLNST